MMVPLHPPQQRPGVLLLREALAGELERDLAVAGQQLPEGLGLEGADLVVAADDHREHRRLHPADAPEDPAGAVADGVVTRRVQADDPVGLAAAARRRVQRVVVGKRTQAAEGIPDRGLGQGAQPEPPGWLAGATGEFQDVAEDELALAAGVGGADDLLGRAEQALDDGELLAGALVLDELDLEVLGHDGKRLQRPALERRVVVLRLLQGGEVPQGPGHLVALALEIPIGPGRGAEEGGELTGDRRLLGEHDSHGDPASELSRPDRGGPASGSRERHRATVRLTGTLVRAIREYGEFIMFYCIPWRGGEEYPQPRWSRHPSAFLRGSLLNSLAHVPSLVVIVAECAVFRPFSDLPNSITTDLGT
jgi:hypothetical protein